MNDVAKQHRGNILYETETNFHRKSQQVDNEMFNPSALKINEMHLRTVK